MLAVGYGFDDRTQLEYVIIKNSWSKSWGEGGFAKVALDQTNYPEGTCGILKSSWIATVQEDYFALWAVKKF